MISKISAYSPNFNGQVKIGKNKKERVQIAKDIKSVPETNRGCFLDSINETKAILATKTPHNVNLTLHVKSYSDCDGLYRGLSVHATDDNNQNERVGQYADVDYAFEGVKKEDFNTDVEKSFNFLQKTVLDNVKAVETSNSVPKTTKEILNRLT